ncbi:hypothetical protein COOONC_25672, partial [Cooperia oncophora]
LKILDLGPQVRYPCGRPPPPPRSDARRSGGGDGSGHRYSSSRQEKVKDSAPRSRRDSPQSSSSTKAKSRSGSKKESTSGGAMGDVTDPWARKKKPGAWTKNNNEAKGETTLADTRLSPPRGDIAGFRIPKKHSAATSRDRISGSARGSSDAGRDLAFSKKSNANPLPSKKPEAKKGREPSRVSDDEVDDTMDSRGAENISDSESAQSVSGSSSAMSSSSSGSSSQSRSPSPALPAKYRVASAKEEAQASAEKNVASVSDSDGEMKKKNRSKSASKGRRTGGSPHLREIRRRQREKSVTPPPPPPPLPLINEFVLERQARKGRGPLEKRSSTEKLKRDRSPPKKKAKINHDGELFFPFAFCDAFLTGRIIH